MHDASIPFSRPFRFAPIASLLLAFLAFFVPALHGQTPTSTAPAIDPPLIVLTDGSGIVERHVAGNNLFVGGDHLPADTTHILELRDETGYLIDSAIATTDETGWLAPIHLWDSGLIGCDSGLTSPPSPYQYFDYEAAEADLDGRLFEVRIRDGAGGTVATTRLPIYADTETPRFYFARADRCPILEYQPGQTVYIAGMHMQATEMMTVDLFLVDQEEACAEPVVSGPEDIRAPFQSTGQQLTFGASEHELYDPIFPTTEVPECIYIRIDNLAEPLFPQMRARSNAKTMLNILPAETKPAHTTLPLGGRPGTHTPNECPPCEEY